MAEKLILREVDTGDMPPEKRSKLANTMQGYLSSLAAEAASQAAATFSRIIDDKVRAALAVSETNSTPLSLRELRIEA